MPKISKKLLIFDFDGVLAIKWTMPEEYFDQIPDLIRKLSKDYILCVASFNPRAQVAIKNWGLEEYFICMRYGSNYTWVDIYKEEYRENMTKANQIIHMIENEIDQMNKLNNKFEYGDVVFFEDNIKNILNVNEKLPWIKTVLINSDIGVNLSDMPNYK